MKLFFEREAPKANLRTPRPSVLPAKSNLAGSALYRASRVGGDYFDFVPISSTRTLFLLSDVAGKREEAMHIAAILQDALHERAPALLGDEDGNVSDAVTSLALELNRTVIQAAGGVRPAPTFIGCLDEQFGLIHYISAGHPPAFIRSDGEITQLDPTGLPFGLFSHATHDAAVSVAHPGSSIILVSKGLVESSSGRQEFGAHRVRQVLEGKRFHSPQHICHELLDTAVKFSQQPSSFGPQFSIAGFRSTQQTNDMTVVCLMRTAEAVAASA
ncbi:MAG TPA: SpoIIE family protein phosphatase [Terriglobales bacterium]|nr:SpoIIE family protein phosphatase [Terriglobales bacterium]